VAILPANLVSVSVLCSGSGEQNEKYSRRFDCWRSNYHCDLDLDLFALGPFTQRANMAARLLFWAIIVLFWASLVLAVLGFYVTFWL